VAARTRIFSTTAFRLSAIYLAVFAAFGVAFIFYISYSIDRLLEAQLHDTIEADIRGIEEQHRLGGVAALIAAVETRSREPAANLYLVADANGAKLAGNINEVPADMLRDTSGKPVTLPYALAAGSARERLAMVEVVALPGGLRMVIGRDLTESERFRGIILRSLGWAVALLAVLGVIGWIYVSRRVLSRIDQATDASRRIMEGDLSGRLAVTGTGDEFDRLSSSLNAMLDRIETLLYSLKDVSDNIAHDLKTPLTRLRNRVEAALSGPPDAASYRAALESTIEESDRLIHTFNALLMIARVEAGAADRSMTTTDATEIVRDVVELYEPVAEEAKVALSASTHGPLPVRANRELLGQALANLVDNAIKHCGAAGEGGPYRVAVSAATEGGHLVLRVDDNGPGVPEEDRDRVLQRFVRLEKSRSAPGSGLGLSLVAAVVRMHKGEITLSDNAPGLSVAIRLPLGAQKP
jgi:signal transduction histidine kinase